MKTIIKAVSGTDIKLGSQFVAVSNDEITTEQLFKNEGIEMPRCIKSLERYRDITRTAQRSNDTSLINASEIEYDMRGFPFLHQTLQDAVRFTETIEDKTDLYRRCVNHIDVGIHWLAATSLSREKDQSKTSWKRYHGIINTLTSMHMSSGKNDAALNAGSQLETHCTEIYKNTLELVYSRLENESDTQHYTYMLNQALPHFAFPSMVGNSKNTSQALIEATKTFMTDQFDEMSPDKQAEFIQCIDTSSFTTEYKNMVRDLIIPPQGILQRISQKFRL